MRWCVLQTSSVARSLPAIDRAPLWVEVVPHLDAKYGGIATSAPRAAVAAEATGIHRSAIVAFCSPDEQVTGLAASVDVFPLGRLKWLTSPALRRSLQQRLEDADAFHIHGLWQEHFAMVTAHAVDRRIPFVVSSHGMLDAWALHNKGVKKQVYSFMTARPRLARAACLRALTTTERDDFRRFGLRNPVATIPTGVDIPDVTAEEFLQRFPVLRGKRIVLYMGRIHHKKGPDLLCRAWAEIHRDFPDAHLVIAGPDSANTVHAIQTIVSERDLGASVLIPGLLDGRLPWSALRAAEIFVLPSHSEGLSRAVLEALGSSVPVLITHGCNFPEVRDHDCGLIVDTDERAVAGALAEMLRAPRSMLRRMGDNGARLIAERYSWSVVGRQQAALYRWVLGGGSPPPELPLDR
jgi:glycosyltransferase involved in cell wall biosynthesis